MKSGEVGNRVGAVYLNQYFESPQGMVLHENHYFRKSLGVKIMELRAEFNPEALTSNPHMISGIK